MGQRLRYVHDQSLWTFTLISIIVIMLFCVILYSSAWLLWGVHWGLFLCRLDRGHHCSQFRVITVIPLGGVWYAYTNSVSYEKSPIMSLAMLYNKRRKRIYYWEITFQKKPHRFLLIYIMLAQQIAHTPWLLIWVCIDKSKFWTWKFNQYALRCAAYVGLYWNNKPKWRLIPFEE